MINEIAFDDYHQIIAWELRAAIARYYDRWEEILDKDEQEREFWTSTIEQARIGVVVFSCALVEYAINFYICVKTDSKEFSKLDRKSLLSKWTEVPREFSKKYELPENSELRNDLIRLIARRKAIVHPKPTISIDGDNRHKGNEPMTVLDEHEFIGRCATLPFRLVQGLPHSETGEWMVMLNIQDCCGGAANEFEKGRRRLELASKYPRELIKEIMQQGHSRRTALMCAILMGDKPETDEAGNILIRHGKTITLRPLKFFASRGHSGAQAQT
jgi:hypothetical protein